MNNKIIDINYDFNKNKIINALLNPLTTSQRNSLSLGVAEEGYVVYDKDLDNLLSWNGFEWGVIGDNFTEDFVVNIDPAKTFLKWRNGQTVPAAGKTPKQLLLEGASESVSPIYISPYAYLTIDQNSSYLEIGQTVNVIANIQYFKNDAGEPSVYSIKKNNTEISNQSSFIDFNVLISNTPKVYSSSVNYPIGNIKNNNLGQPDAFGRILAGQITTNSINLFGYYKIFYGASSNTPLSSPEVRNLQNSRFTNEPLTFILNTGNFYNKFSIAIPSTLSLQEVIDIDALNANVTLDYIQSSFFVNDANGSPVLYKVLTMSNAIAYSNNHRHQITLI
jgi:hypothetical protein